MSVDTSTQPRRLQRFWYLVRDGLPSAGRYRRYTCSLLPCLVVIWGLVALYLILAPVSYKSSMTLVLPGSGAGGSINLESIGQATSQTTSAFSSPSLSPTQNYKRLLGADLILRQGAAGLDDEILPDPTVKLVDQTNLIMVSMRGASPEQAQARLEALRLAFLSGLERLRQDEAEKREAADLERLDELEQKLKQAQRRVLEFQGTTGLATLDQFHQRLSVVDDLQGSEREFRQAVRRSEAQAYRLGEMLDITLDEARSAQLLRADPLFQSLLQRYASVLADWTQARATLGEQHLTLTELSAQRQTLRQSLVQRGTALTPLSAEILLGFADLSVSDGRERLLDELMRTAGNGAGAQAALAEVREQISQQSNETDTLVEQAADLTDLLRELRVAEAVFSSALARLDTNKADPFASYPLVQTFEYPSLPRSPSSPSTLLAVAGAVVASILVIMGFLLLWLRQPLIQLMLPKS
ncbi:hypothetical protein LCL99_09840 [Halomonas denitrificans]|uniref:hypothetical protein n=1 Tax=Halomonas denitrificans TaxID=370769 RepID=UPI001CD5D7AD|nr:hypothetical protein [Halomonas denitrificans]MCA0974773.1 hypothetical protein [Halomonas denitrificans]